MLHPSPTSQSPDTATIPPSQHLTTARSTRGRLVASASERRSAANPHENYRAPGKNSQLSTSLSDLHINFDFFPVFEGWPPFGKHDMDLQCFQEKRSWFGHKHFHSRHLELN